MLGRLGVDMLHSLQSMCRTTLRSTLGMRRLRRMRQAVEEGVEVEPHRFHSLMGRWRTTLHSRSDIH